VGELVRSMIGKLETERMLNLQATVLQTEAVAVVDESDRILFITERAEQLLQEYFPATPAGFMPREILRWLGKLPSPGATMTKTVATGILTCTCRGSTPWQESKMHVLFNGGPSPACVRCVRFDEHCEKDRILSLKKLGLTPREAEVLYWIMEGKSNAEIAIILNAEMRTVAKHCQNVFTKLRVDNRTSAALLARSVL